MAGSALGPGLPSCRRLVPSVARMGARTDGGRPPWQSERWRPTTSSWVRGAMGMAFTDALIDHADVHVTLVDRRHAAGGHWRDAYPLRAAPSGVSVLRRRLDGARRWQRAAERPGGWICTSAPVARRSRPTTTTSSIAGSSALGAGHLPRRERIPDRRLVPSRDVAGVGRDRGDRVRRRLVDATYLSPAIPATTTRRSLSLTMSPWSPSTSWRGWPPRRTAS